MWASYLVGRAYQDGKVVGKNLGYAEQRYIKAANKGFVLAMTALVSLYSQNSILSFDKSLEQRRRWALSAFERGDAMSASSMQSTYTPFGLDCNAWHNVYLEAFLASGSAVANSTMYEGKTPQERIQILLKTQEFMRIFNHIEPTNPFPWRK